MQTLALSPTLTPTLPPTPTPNPTAATRPAAPGPLPSGGRRAVGLEDSPLQHALALRGRLGLGLGFGLGLGLDSRTVHCNTPSLSEAG